MAPDLLSTIAGEIEERLARLRPLNAEYEQLLVAAEALDSERAEAAAPRRRGRPRGSGAGRAGASAAVSSGRSTASAKRTTRTAASKRVTRTATSTKRSVKGAAREAILAALDHGSHTVAELAVVTAMKPANINGNVRRLLAEGAIEKTARQGKTAYALPGKG